MVNERSMWTDDHLDSGQRLWTEHWSSPDNALTSTETFKSEQAEVGTAVNGLFEWTQEAEKEVVKTRPRLLRVTF